MQVATFDDFVQCRNLWLLHIGHSWFVYRLGDGDAVLDDDMIERIQEEDGLPEAMEVQEVRKFSDPDDFRSFAKILQRDKSLIAETLNTALPDQGFQMVLGLRGWGV